MYLTSWWWTELGTAVQRYTSHSVLNAICHGGCSLGLEVFVDHCMALLNSHSSGELFWAKVEESSTWGELAVGSIELSPCKFQWLLRMSNWQLVYSVVCFACLQLYANCQAATQQQLR
jgi:hypothetical protein